ncbi:MAG: hypothetical protein RSF92_07855 [Niameybacter sp.]|uniref:uracil-DNA glycosylase family protein n=1 Tax=Niameybacter sp. TaxID=2033640 RepID=UPI002FCA7CFD
MSKTFNDYLEVIKTLPLKKSYTKEDILIPELLIEKQKDIELYYCTHNAYINPKAKVFIVGITPGFNQMNKSLVAARRCIEEQIDQKEIPYICKKEARFEGSLRKNLIGMLEALELEKYLAIENATQLFNERDDLLHTTSMIPYAAFVKGKNYTGHQPPILKSECLMSYVETHFYPQVEALKDALIIPLGKSVEEVLMKLIEVGTLKEAQCLLGFPHPSGANAHKHEQFATHKEAMMKKIKRFVTVQ